MIDENGVEGETRVVDAATESVSAQTDAKKPATLDSAKLQVPHKKKSDAVASESKPSAAETKPNKKSKKAAGTRNIMCARTRATSAPKSIAPTLPVRLRHELNPL